MSDWIFGSVWRWTTLCGLVLALVVGIHVYFIVRESNTDDIGNHCPNGVRWEMPDEGICYRECVIASASSGNPDYATDQCVRKVCLGYARICR